MRLPRSLQGRLLVLVLGLVAGVWLATAALTWFDVRHELDELLDSHLAQAASLLVAQQAGELEDDDHGVDAPTLHRYAPKVAFQVFHEGRLVLRSSNAPAEPMLAFAGRVEIGFRTVTMGGATWRVFATHGGERDVQVFVGEQVRVARLHPVGGAAQRARADAVCTAAAGARGVVGGAPRCRAAEGTRPRARATRTAGPAADRGAMARRRR